VPLLQGLSVGAAQAALRRTGLAVNPTNRRDYDERIAAGLVIRTDPAKGELLPPGTQVTLYVSQGPRPVPVPSVTGKPQAEATAVLHAAGFVVATTAVFSDTVPTGTVVSQSPASGTAPRGSTVTLAVSKGPDLVVVPDVRGDKVEDAQRKLTAAGLTSRVDRLHGGPGRVLETDPRHGTKVKRGSSVTVLVF
jgi:serine/threonine-protein kinase